MIISCLNCDKKFNIDQKLIPEKGRLLQCSSCNHKWHYTSLKKENEIEIKEEIQNYDNEKKIINPSLKKETITNKEKKINNNKDIETKNIKKNLEIKSKISNNKFNYGNIIGNLLIITITFFALILILDTFKIGISNYVPILIPFLDNFYEPFYHLNSFLKDLLN
tara:strand:+ start:535 stop:1029 length:495 start_codon:yes stop_codon:yes gene_type:complete